MLQTYIHTYIQTDRATTRGPIGPKNDITSFTSYDKYHLGMGCVPLPQGSSQGQMELEIFRFEQCFGRSLNIGIFVFK